MSKTRKENLIAMRDAMVAGEIIQSSDASMLWPTTYNKETGENILPWRYLCKGSQGSMDAALAFVAAVLPRWVWCCGHLHGYSGSFTAVVSRTPHPDSDQAKTFASNPALALILAALEALIEMEDATPEQTENEA